MVVASGDGKDVAKPFEIVVDRLALRDLPGRKVCELVEEDDRRRDGPKNLLVSVPISTTPEVVKVGEGRGDITNPVKGTIDGSKRFEEGDEGTRNEAFIESEDIGEITDEAGELKAIAGVNVNAQNVVTPEDGDVQLTDYR
jgi:hypothetical protein